MSKSGVFKAADPDLRYVIGPRSRSICFHHNGPGLVFSYKLRYIVGLGLVEIEAILTTPKLLSYLTCLVEEARSARADARLCTSSGINLIVPLFSHSPVSPDLFQL